MRGDGAQDTGLTATIVAVCLEVDLQLIALGSHRDTTSSRCYRFRVYVANSQYGIATLAHRWFAERVQDAQLPCDGYDAILWEGVCGNKRSPIYRCLRTRTS